MMLSKEEMAAIMAQPIFTVDVSALKEFQLWPSERVSPRWALCVLNNGATKEIRLNGADKVPEGTRMIYLHPNVIEAIRKKAQA